MGGWDVVDISTEKVEGESVGGYDIKEIIKEKVLDTDPNLYLQRAEQMLREGKYDEAVKEAGTAVKYSNNIEVLNEFNKIKAAVESYKKRTSVDNYTKVINETECKESIDCYNNFRKSYEKLNRGFYEEAIIEANSALKHNVNSKKFLEEYKIIKNRIENEINETRSREGRANYFLKQSAKNIELKKYDEALHQAKIVFYYSSDVNDMNEANRLRKIAAAKKNEVIAENLIKKAYMLINEGRYDEGLKQADNAISCSGIEKYSNEKEIMKIFINNRKNEK